MKLKNCSNCGTSNPAEAISCSVCSSATFFAVHEPVGEVDGPKPTAPTTVIVVEVPVGIGETDQSTT